MNTVFEIGTISRNDPKALLLEIGENFCVRSYLRPAEKLIEAVSVHTFDPVNIEEVFPQLLSDHGTIQQAVLSSAFPQALLIPRKLYQPSLQLVQAIYDEPQWHSLEDAINEWQIVNSYSIPRSLYQLATATFSSVQFIHTYTAALKIFNGFSADNQIAAHFVSNQFMVLVKKEGQIQLVQTYNYTSPMDVVYFLLKICTEFGMTQEDTFLVISGFVEQQSALYKELYQYFLNIHFASVATVQLPEHEYPDHFFTSIHNLAACVS